ncbi:uncharacterized protein TNCV_3391181 [Trichonephila clavipes]|nr:uncharacterized protein TNCV_3391181 [Trichonephila clavipes]
MLLNWMWEWLVTLTAVPQGQDSNPREGMDVCKCTVPVRHGGTPNSRPATSPPERLVERKERWEASEHLQRVHPQNWDGTEPNHTVTCMVFKASANDGGTPSPLQR